MSEDANATVTVAVREISSEPCRTYGLFLVVSREGRGDVLESASYFLYVHVVENVKDRSVPGLHNGVINTHEVGPKTDKHVNELAVHTVIGTTGQ